MVNTVFTAYAKQVHLTENEKKTLCGRPVDRFAAVPRSMEELCSMCAKVLVWDEIRKETLF